MKRRFLTVISIILILTTALCTFASCADKKGEEKPTETEAEKKPTPSGENPSGTPEHTHTFGEDNKCTVCGAEKDYSLYTEEEIYDILKTVTFLPDLTKDYTIALTYVNNEDVSKIICTYNAAENTLAKSQSYGESKDALSAKFINIVKKDGEDFVHYELNTEASDPADKYDAMIVDSTYAQDLPVDTFGFFDTSIFGIFGIFGGKGSFEKFKESNQEYFNEAKNYCEEEGFTVTVNECDTVSVYEDGLLKVGFFIKMAGTAVKEGVECSINIDESSIATFDKNGLVKIETQNNETIKAGDVGVEERIDEMCFEISRSYDASVAEGFDFTPYPAKADMEKLRGDIIIIDENYYLQSYSGEWGEAFDYAAYVADFESNYEGEGKTVRKLYSDYERKNEVNPAELKFKAIDQHLYTNGEAKDGYTKLKFDMTRTNSEDGSNYNGDFYVFVEKNADFEAPMTAEAFFTMIKSAGWTEAYDITDYEISFGSEKLTEANKTIAIGEEDIYNFTVSFTLNKKSRVD